MLAIVCVFLISCNTQAAILTPAQYREQAISNSVRAAERTWKSFENPPATLGVREIFVAALAYCEGRTNLDRLERIFEMAAKMQDRDPASRGYGNFRWSWGHAEVLDYNAVDFCMQTASMIWLHHRDAMPAGARARLRELIELGLEGLRRHRVNETYTNIALMNAGDLILLGEAFGQPALAEEGYARLDRFLLAMWEAGTHEYNSPTYYGVDLDDLELLEAFCGRQRGQAQARALLEYFWTDIAANWFAAARKLGGARSRDYDYLRGLGTLDQQLLANGWLTPEDKLVPNNLMAIYSTWQIPGRLVTLANKQFPRYVRQIWGFEPFQGRAHCVCQDISLSASGASYGGRMDLPLTVDLPGPREHTRCYFIPDAREDPYGKIKIAESKAHSKTLHLSPFWTAVQRKTDALGLVIYREKDLNPTNETLQSHFVMPADADEFWVGSRQLKIAPGMKAEYPVAPEEAVILRQGSAAVGIKVPWTRSLDGQPARIALVADGNAYGAIRLTVNHHSSAVRQFAGINPGAVFWVRIGSALDETGFQKWKSEFMSGQAKVSATLSNIEANVQGIEGPLTVAAATPFSVPAKLVPPYPRTLLAVDGQDLGRQILEQIEPLKTVAASMKAAQPVRVAAKSATKWEAESCQLVPPFTVAADAQASGGSFIWMPAEPGERGSSSIGSASYKLNVTVAGSYYLWGRVLSPTPENDSFFVRLVTGEQTLLPNTTWAVGVHQQWTWVRLNAENGKGAMPLRLPAGESTLQIRIREAGTKLDTLCLTTSPDAAPY